MSAPRIRVLLVDDHPIVLKGLIATLEPELDMEVVASAATAHQALELFKKTRPDVTIMDIKMTREMTGIEAILAIRREFAEARIVVLSAFHGDDLIFRALQAGAITYLLKETLGDNLVSIIREVHSGGGPIPPEVARKLANRISQSVLTARETEVLKLIAEGLRNKEIAARLAIGNQTVEFHIKNILSKLDVNDRTKAVSVGVRRGIIDIHSE
jgi:two-component system, NarL family, response regulator